MRPHVLSLFQTGLARTAVTGPAANRDTRCIPGTLYMSAVATDSRQSLSARTADRRLWRSALVLLIILECAPFWIFPYFPSQDGPSHLHNASVLAHYGTTQ